MNPLIGPADLAAQLGAPGLIVFDATLYLPNEGKDARRLFEAAHIPGARFFDVDAVADEPTALPHMVPTQGRFTHLIGRLGVSNESRIVFYDQRGLFSAARGWWLMRLFGHDEAFVLDGGLPAWLADGRPTEAGPEAPAAPATFRPALRAGMLAGLGDVREASETRSRPLLDARAAARFAGTVPEPRPGVRPGHVPGAASVPFTDLLGPDHRMLPPDALRARFAEAGAGPDAPPPITYCGSGVTAAVLTLGLAVAGLPTGALYDGSWSEWGARDDLPAAT